MSKTKVINDSNDNIFFHYAFSSHFNINIHLHDGYEIFQALSNNIRYFIDGKYYDLNPGDLIITNPSEIHRPLCLNKKPYERRFIQFKSDIYSNLPTKNNPLNIINAKKEKDNNAIIISLKENDEIYKLLNKIQAINSDKSLSNIKDLLMYTLTLEILIYISEFHRNSLSNQTTISNVNPLITEIKNKLDIIYCQPFNLDKFSQEYFIDKYYLCHLYKKHTGFSIYEYIQIKRIQKAKMLIKRGETMTYACKQSGFNDYSNFYKAFKKYVNCSPRDYQKNKVTS